MEKLITKKCLFCGNDFNNFYVRKDRINRPSKGIMYWSPKVFSVRKFCSQYCLSKSRKGSKLLPFSEERRKRMGLARKGKKHTEETKKVLSEIRKDYYRKGNRPWNYNGGICETVRALRKTYKYQMWRKLVIERDNYSCTWCGKNNCRLDVDHIKPFALYPEFRFSVENGRTLCVDCHRKTETYGRRNIYDNLLSKN